MLVKIAPLGEKVVEVNVEPGTTIEAALEIVGILHNERSILLNNTASELSTPITTEGSIVVLAQKMKGGRG